MRLQAILLLAGLLACMLMECSCESRERARERRNLEFLKREQIWHQQLEEHYSTLFSRPPKPSLETTDPDDVEALKALYQSTNGDKWSKNTGWLKGDPCQDLWYGLYCLNGRVLQINIVFNGMTGILPAELAKADMLQVLRLYSNRIGGTIPPEILSMKSLQILDLNHNQFNGTLPNTISMPNITQLVLYVNDIQGRMPTEWDAPQLQILSLSSNAFTGPLPSGVSNLKNIRNITFSRNHLTGSLPSSYGNLANLEQLWLFINQFENSSIPSSWSGMRNMRDIEVDSLAGMLPDWIGSSWTKLQHLVLTNGALKGELPTSICELTELVDLRIFGNSLTGQLPSCICNLRSLQLFEISDNLFTGNIPSCIDGMSELTMLYLSRNNFSGILPDTLGYLDKLQLIDVSSNGFYGTVPATFNSFTNHLYQFSLCYNKFSQFEEGLEDFFDFIKNYGCELYSNPWECPTPTYIPNKCGAQCSQCNTGDKHNFCSYCEKDSDCGWCNEGPNCLEGRASGPDTIYRCNTDDWFYGSSQCP